MSASLNGTNGITFPDSTTMLTAQSLGTRNILINGGFTINQRVYVSAAALASGVYGHDRWKAGASGGDYSFTQLNSPTTITIAASKSIIQVVENVNVAFTSYVLSWTGTAVARYAVNSATPSGTFAVSPILITGQTVGTTMSVEFTGANAVGTSAVASNTGTLGNVQLEYAVTTAVATPFEFRPFSIEDMLCKRYYENSCPVGTTPNTTASATTHSILSTSVATGSYYFETTFKVQKRAVPTVATWPYTTPSANAVWSNNVGTDYGAASATPVATTSGFILTNSFGSALAITATAMIGGWSASCEL